MFRAFQGAKTLRIFAFTVVSIMYCQPIESYSTTVMRSLSNDSASQVDKFSIPTCGSSYCRRVPGAVGCASGDCCTCQCAYHKATYFFNNTSDACISNKLIFNKCEFHFTKNAHEPTLVADMTSARGSVKFQTSPQVQCQNNNGVIVSQWQYLLNGQWIEGQVNIFSVESLQVGGRNNPRKLNFLKWTKALGMKYSGLIVKFHLKCEQGRASLGCSLIKIQGSHMYPALVPITTKSTPHSEHTAGRPTADTSALGSTAAVLGGQDSRKKNEGESDSSNNTLVVAMAAAGGAVAVLCVVCVAVMLCRRRRQKERSNYPLQAETKSTAANKAYEESMYAEVPEEGSMMGKFDNPTYVDSEEQTTKQRSRMDPLPPVPAQEIKPENEPGSTYQSLVRQEQDYQMASQGPKTPAYEYPVCPTFPANEKPAQPISREDYENPRMPAYQQLSEESRSPDPTLYDNENPSRTLPTDYNPSAVPGQSSQLHHESLNEDVRSGQEPFYVILEEPVLE